MIVGDDHTLSIESLVKVHRLDTMSRRCGIGVDGCPAGWVMVTVTNGRVLPVDVFETVAELYQTVPKRTSVVLLDMPIGLSPGGREGRECDRLGRQALGPRRSSLFPTPSRPVLDARTYEDACAKHHAVTGTKISKQAWFLIPKIREIDAFLLSDAYGGIPLRECHPEIAFASLQDGVPMRHPKKHPLGFLDRLRLLETLVDGVEDVVRDAVGRFDAKSLVVDDVLDAMVLAFLSSLGSKELATFPAKPPLDAAGIPMELVYKKGAF